MAAAVLAGCLVLAAAGCQGGRPRAERSAPVTAGPASPLLRQRRERLAGVCAWAPVFGGVEAAMIQGYDLAVVDAVESADGGADTSPAEVRSLQARGTLVLAYLSVGTVERFRHYARRVPLSWTLGPVDGWPDERYADPRQPGWRELAAGEARTLAAAGFDGLYLDNLDVAEEFPRTADALVELVGGLRRAAPDLLLVAQNGLAVDDRLPIDAVAHEDVFWRWDGRYRASTPAETAPLLAGLRRLRARGVPVFTLDYAEAGSPGAQAALARSLAEGFRPAVSVLDLDRLPHAVPDCGGRPPG